MKHKVLYTYNYNNKFYSYNCIEDTRYGAYGNGLLGESIRNMKDWQYET